MEFADPDGADRVLADDLAGRGVRMIETNRKYGASIRVGCCGTRFEHLESILDHNETREERTS